MPKFLEKEKTKTKKQNALLTKQYQDSLRNKKAAYDHLKGNSYTLTDIILDRPDTIEADVFTAHRPYRIDADVFTGWEYGGIRRTVVEKHFESWNSWVRITPWQFFWTKNGFASLSPQAAFYFAWQNYNTPMVINVHSDLTVRGHGVVQAFSGAMARCGLRLAERLWVYPSPSATPVPSNQEEILPLEAHTGPFPGHDMQAEASVFATRTLSVNNILVPSGAVVVFKVQIEAQMWSDEGTFGPVWNSTFCEFNEKPYVNCPALVIQLLTPLPAGPVNR